MKAKRRVNEELDCNKMLKKDIMETFPFNKIRIPRFIQCVECECSDAGRDFYNGESHKLSTNASDLPWKWVQFKGKYILVSFLSDDLGRYSEVFLDEFRIIATPAVDSRLQVETLAYETNFVREVLDSNI